MTARSHADMVALTDALYRAASAKMQRILSEEARLRADLSQLETMRGATQDMPQGDASGYRAVGADLLWQGGAALSRGKAPHRASAR